MLENLKVDPARLLRRIVGRHFLYSRAVLSTRMPNRKNFEFGSTHTVVHIVANPIEQESAYLK